MATFATLFQSAVSYPDLVSFHIDDLIDAVSNASNRQYAIIETKVKPIVTSFKKGDALLIPPVLATVQSEDHEVYHCVSGRHRISAIAQFIREYGVTPTGKYALLTPDNPSLETIDPTVNVRVVKVKDIAGLSALMMAENGSRSMTSAEKITLKSVGNLATPGEAFKLKIANGIKGVLPELTEQTCLDMAANLNTKIGKDFKHVTAEQLEYLLRSMAEFLDENRENTGVVPTNMAREYKTFVEEFLNQDILFENQEGDEIMLPFGEYLASIIVKPAPKAKKPNADIVIAELQAKLAELMAAQAAQA